MVLVLILFLIPFINSAPPVTQVQQFNEGYVVKVPLVDYHSINNQLKLNFHIFNISNGKPVYQGVSCDLHLYNNSGSHVFEQYSVTTPDHIYDFEFNIDGGNFTTP